MTDAPARDRLEQLLARSALGDRTAFADLYQATSAKLFGVLLRILKDEDMAEDALQDVFTRVWDSARDYHAGRGTVMTWLLSITRYRAIDMLRRARAGMQFSHDPADAPDAQPAPGPDPVELTCRAADSGVLARCLEQLDAPRRACLVLAYCEGYTHDELSLRLGSPVGTVKSWIRRGLQVLKDCLERHDG